jgi:hypothetical protein
MFFKNFQARALSRMDVAGATPNWVTVRKGRPMVYKEQMTIISANYAIFEKNYFMNFKDITLKSLAIISLGLTIFYIDYFEFWNPLYTTILLVIISLFKSGFFVIQSYKKISDTSNQNVEYYHFLFFMAINIVLIIISFGIDFFCLHQIDPKAFSGVYVHASIFRQLFEFLYYSSLNMTNFGFAETLPISMTAKFLTSIEVFLSFVAIIFVLSDFISLRESLNKRKSEQKNPD